MNATPIYTLPDLVESVATRHYGARPTGATYQWSGWDRVTLQRRRAAILAENHADLIAERIVRTYQSPHLKSQVLPFVSVAMNPGADVTKAIACCYKEPITRSLAGAGRRAERAFDALNFDSKMHALAPATNRAGWFVGPVLEWPRVVNGRFERVFITSERFEVVLERDDMLGDPSVVAFPWALGDVRVVVVADANTYRYFDADAGARLKQIKVERHFVGAQPCTVHRWDKPQDPMDWWCADRHQRAVDATISAGYAYTNLDWVRKNQNRPFWYFFGSLKDKVDGQQLGDTEEPFVHHVREDQQQPQIGTVDLTADVGGFVEHIRFTYQALIEAYGVPPSSMTFAVGESGLPAAAIDLSADRMAALRNEQIPFARANEWSSAWRALAVAKGMGHRAADDLPGPEFILEARETPGRGLNLDWPELARHDNPTEKREQKKFLISRGHWSDVDEELARHPEIGDDREAAKARLISRIREQKEIDAEKAQTPTGGLGADMQTEAERTGEQGPAARDNPEPESVDADEDTDE